MKVAELFVKLGITGTDDASKGVSKVDKGMKGLVSRGLAVKAGLLAIGYGLQRLMSGTAKTGTSLTQFAAATGLSAETLQKWQYAGKSVGIQADEISGTFKGLQSAMTDMALNGGLNSSMAFISQFTDIDPTKLNDTFYVMQKLTEFAQKAPANLSRNLLGQLGVSDNIIAGMRKGAFDAQKIASAPALTNGQVSNLNDINAAWERFDDRIKKAMGRFNAKYGKDMIRMMEGLINPTMRLAGALTKLADQMGVFKYLGDFFTGSADFLEGKTAYQQLSTGEKWQSFFENLKHNFQSPGNKNDRYWFDSSDFLARKLKREKALSAPPVNSKVDNKSVTVNQTMNFQTDGRNAQEVGGATRKAISDAYKATNGRQRGN